MAASPRTKPSNDFTGRQAAVLAKEAAEDGRRRADQLSQITAQEEQEFESSIFDTTASPDAPTVIDEVLEVGVELADHSVVVRMAEDVENMTFGYRNTYHFKAGGRYKVPLPVANRLQELGLIYERL